MAESTYILMQRIANVRTACNILSDCRIKRGSLLQGVLILLENEKEDLSSQLGDLEIKDEIV